MIIRLDERLDITEEQKLELTSMLFSFLKKIREEDMFRDFSTVTLASCWFKYVEKPEWVEKKIKEEIDFVAGVCEFVERYKDSIDDVEIEEVAVMPKGSLNGDVLDFLREVSVERDVSLELNGDDYFDRRKMFCKLDEMFYINGKDKDNIFEVFPELSF